MSRMSNLFHQVSNVFVSFFLFISILQRLITSMEDKNKVSYSNFIFIKDRFFVKKQI